MSLVDWGSVTHCVFSRENCFTPFLPLCVEPVLGPNKAGLSSWTPGCADKSWEERGTRLNLETMWKSRILEPDASTAIPCFYPLPETDTLPLGNCKVELSTCPLFLANRGDSSRCLNTELLSVWVPILQGARGCLKLR